MAIFSEMDSYLTKESQDVIDSLVNGGAQPKSYRVSSSWRIKFSEMGLAQGCESEGLCSRLPIGPTVHHSPETFILGCRDGGASP